MMPQPSLVELAKLGNVEAIATLLNRSLQPQGITAKASIKGYCLRVILESQNIPEQDTLVKFIQQGLKKLSVESIKTVKIYGKRTGQDFPGWRYHFDLIHQAQPIIFSQATHSSSNQETEQKPTKSSLKNPSNQGSLPKRRSKFKEFIQAFGSYQVWSRVLLILIGLRFIFDILFVFYSLTWVTSYYLLDLISAVDSTRVLSYLFYPLFEAIEYLRSPLKSVGGWIYLFTALITLIWLYRLHVRLKELFIDYPITPWGAIARYLIPLYSIWGIWNIFATLAKKLKSQAGELIRWGSSLHRWLPWLYLSLITSILLHLFSVFQSREADNSGTNIWVFVLNNVSNLLFSLVFLQIVRITTKAIAEKTQQSTESSSTQ